MSRNSARILIAGLGAMSLSGCAADYLNHYDTVSLTAGDAQRHNRLLHTTDPFNPVSRDVSIETDGRRTADVVEKYRSGQTKASAPAASPVTINMGAGPGG